MHVTAELVTPAQQCTYDTTDLHTHSSSERRRHGKIFYLRNRRNWTYNIHSVYEKHESPVCATVIFMIDEREQLSLNELQTRYHLCDLFDRF
jgi:DNA primase